MNETQITDRLRQIFAAVFQLDEQVASTLGTSDEPNEISKWDSAGHLTLMLEIERAFNVEIPNLMVTRLGHFRLIRSYLRQEAGRAPQCMSGVNASQIRCALPLECAAPAVDQTETNRRFVREITRLNLWYVHQLLARGEIGPDGLCAALSRRVNIYRMTTLWTGTDGVRDRDPTFGFVDPEWSRLSRELARMILAAPPDNTSGLEAQGLALLWPLLEPAIQARSPAIRGPRPFGCWTYKVEWEGVGDRPGWVGKLLNVHHMTQFARKKLGLPKAPSRHATIHFENALRPESPFGNMSALARSLCYLIENCRGRHPSVRTLWCHSWLNSLPAFCKLFPPCWQANAIPQAPGNYPSWWGQFQTMTGDFNYKVAARFRASGGRFPYTAPLCHTPIDELGRQLARLAKP